MKKLILFLNQEIFFDIKKCWYKKTGYFKIKNPTFWYKDKGINSKTTRIDVRITCIDIQKSIFWYQEKKNQE